MFVIHHAIPFMVDANGSMLGTWPVHEVGRNADFFAEDAGRLIKAGSTMVLPSVHLHSNGVATTAQLDIGFKFHPRGYKPTQQTQFMLIGATQFADNRIGACFRQRSWSARVITHPDRPNHQLA